MNKLVPFLITIHCVFAFSPMFSSGIYAAVHVGVMATLAICICFNIKSFYGKQILLYYFLFFTFQLLYFFVGISKGGIYTICFPLFSFFFSIIITIYCFENMQAKELKRLLIIVVFIAFADILYNSIFCTIYPHAASESVKDLGLHRINVGGTKFSHFSLSFFMLSFCMFLECKKNWLRFLFIILALLSAYYIVLCGQRMTVIIFLFISISLLVISKISNKIGIYIVIVAIVAVIVANNMEMLLDKFAVNVESERIEQRVNSLNNTASSGIDDDSFSGRVFFYRMSLETFFSGFLNFVFGVGYHQAETSSRYIIGIGGHSQIFDLLAMYGIIGALLIFGVLKNTYKYMFTIIEDKRHLTQLSLVFIIFICMSALKYTFDDHNSLLLCFSLPLLYKLIETSNSKLA